VLDEPTVGLDPKQIIKIRELIRELAGESTLLLSTHILPEVELLCGRVVIIDRGRIVAEGSPESLRESWRGKTEVQVALEAPSAEAQEVLGRVTGIASVRPDVEATNRYILECEPATDPRAEVFRLAVERGWVLIELAQRQASLEDIFVRLTTRDVADAAPAPAAEMEVQA
jgi:ABC-2 type transport system ATP-binding protein